MMPKLRAAEKRNVVFGAGLQTIFSGIVFFSLPSGLEPQLGYKAKSRRRFGPDEAGVSKYCGLARFSPSRLRIA